MRRHSTQWIIHCTRTVTAREQVLGKRALPKKHVTPTRNIQPAVMGLVVPLCDLLPILLQVQDRWIHSQTVAETNRTKLNRPQEPYVKEQGEIMSTLSTQWLPSLYDSLVVECQAAVLDASSEPSSSTSKGDQKQVQTNKSFLTTREIAVCLYLCALVETENGPLLKILFEQLKVWDAARKSRTPDGKQRVSRIMNIDEATSILHSCALLGLIDQTVLANLLHHDCYAQRWAMTAHHCSKVIISMGKFRLFHHPALTRFIRRLHEALLDGTFSPFAALEILEVFAQCGMRERGVVLGVVDAVTAHIRCRNHQFLQLDGDEKGPQDAAQNDLSCPLSSVARRKILVRRCGNRSGFSAAALQRIWRLLQLMEMEHPLLEKYLHSVMLNFEGGIVVDQGGKDDDDHATYFDSVMVDKVKLAAVPD